MKITDIPFEVTCHGEYAEVQVPSGGWLRVRQVDETFIVTQFDSQKRHVAGPDELTDKQLAELLV